MIFDEAFIQSVSEDPISGIVKIVDKVQSKIDPEFQYWTDDYYEALFEGYCLVNSVIESFGIETRLSSLDFSGELDNDCRNLNEFLIDIRKEFQSQAANLKLSYLKNSFASTLGRAFMYEFSDGDLQRIQSLLNELRDLVSESKLFEEKHRRRLLKRVENIQRELHKKQSNLDHFWGLVGDAGVAIGKFGKNAKPFVDRIKEITNIVWRTQSRAEELPSDSVPPALLSTDEEA